MFGIWGGGTDLVWPTIQHIWVWILLSSPFFGVVGIFRCDPSTPLGVWIFVLEITFLHHTRSLSGESQVN